MKIILIGIQGAGKSTQGNLLSKHLKVPYLSSGHIFRRMAKEKTPWGRYVKETINSGALMPDGKVLEVVEEYLNRPEYQKGYILDGFPRTVLQAKKFKNGVDAVIYLNVSDKEAVWRLYGRLQKEVDVREDNTLKAIQTRLEAFHKHTKPVISHYRHRRILVEVNGERSIKDIYTDIIKKLRKYGLH